MPDQTPTPSQARALLELDRGTYLILRERNGIHIARWSGGRANARSGKLRAGTARALLRRGWIEPIDPDMGKYVISETGSEIAAGLAEADTIQAPKATMTASDVMKAINARRPISRGWVVAQEFSVLEWGGRYADAFAIKSRTEVIAYEIKVDRGDFLAELKDPQKRLEAMRFSSQFYFATPADLVDKHEIPEGCGLLWVWSGGRSRVRYRAPWNMPVPPPDWGMVARFGRALSRSKATKISSQT